MTIELPKPIAVTPVPNVRYREFTKCGQKPLAGGQIWTYDANSTTLKVTYKDPYGMSPNTNPIILDAAGEADIYLNGTYRFVVKDRNGVVQKDISKIGSWYSGDLDDQLKSVNDLLESSAQTLMQPLQDAIAAAAAAGAGAEGWTDTLVATSILDAPNQNLLNARTTTTVSSIAELAALAVWPGRTVFIKTRNGEENSFFAGTFVYSKNATDTIDNGIVLDAEGGRWIRKIENSVIKAQWFGTPTQIDDQKILNPAFSAAISKGLPVDITGNNWGINGTVKAVGHINVIADFANYVEADPAGNYPNKFAFEFGDHSSGAGEGRTVLQITGYLHVSCKNRATRLNGIFIKGSFLNIESIRANNFSGTGVKLESVWDSVFSRISVELCGNEVDYAFVCDSKDDTSNCLNIVSLQVEQSYQRGIFIFNTIRSVINNIHSERLYRTNKNTANTPVGYDLNHVIYMSNSMINQAIFHSNDGEFYMRLDGANSDYNCILTYDGNLYGEFGDHINYSNLSAKSFLQTGALTQITFDNPRIESILVYQNVVITNPTIKNLIFGYACKNVTTKGGSIENVGADTSSTNINGQISFNNTTIKNVYEVGYNTVNPTSFYACNIENFYGKYGGTAYVNGGYISNADLASDFAGIFDAAKFSSFKSNGSRKYLTRACSASGSVTWGLPNLDMQSGLITERIGYDAAGKIYQNTATGVNWVKIA
ncbi:hypothetical protein [Acinetobacter sp. 243_ASPC]|uniref:hypothetical protein n=1 Tax=Acinetobacter sp. 243_ASPC TaxID=1579345 RepID=UPI000B16334D|nr:hypothetical protein [Acinetobacter sp. 243_ASPC]